MDNFLLHAIVTELESVLIEPPGHRRVGRIYQFGATDLMIDLRLRDERWLAISTDPQRLALYLTSRSPRQTGEEARSDTAFVALAKKHLTSARLAGLEKLGYDRIVKFEFTAEAEDSPPRPLTLIVRLTGRGANVLLVEGSQILAALRELDETVTSYADPPPPPEKLDPFLCPPEKLDELIARSGHDLAEAATKYLIGFSPIYARELAVRAARQAPEPALRGLLAEIFDSPPSPALYGSRSIDELRRRPGDDDFSAGISPIELVHLADQRQARFPTVNQAAEAYFTLIGERRRFLALKQRLQTHLSSRLKKQRALLANLQRERERFADASTQQRYGELLLANLHQALKADAGFLVTDYYDSAQATIEIPAANKATPQEAAEHYFKLARKARHGLEKICARVPEVEQELARLEAQRTQLEAVVQPDELELRAQQISPPSTQPAPDRRSDPAPRRARPEKLPGVRRYRSTDGYEILVGRTDRDNDHLTFRISKSYDLWLHAADYPGSHVVLRNPQRQQVPPQTIAEAAQLAAKFSQAKGGAKVAVNYCERKFVTKMKGFAPGQVRLSSFKTILVEPAEAGERLW